MATPTKETDKTTKIPELIEVKMRCLELAKLIPAGQEEQLEKKAAHFYNWIVNGENK